MSCNADEMPRPNRVDPWGPDWSHDWTTWRKMLPQYLDELVGS